jgi:uncharacterized membrane protein YhhN
MLPVIVCAVAVGGLLLAEARDSRPGVWLTKPLASIAFLWTALAGGALHTLYGRWIFCGLVLCLAGDVLLIPTQRSAVFRAGVISFLLGHVGYSIAFMTRPLNAWGVVASAALLAVMMYFVWRWLAGNLPVDMTGSVRAYLAVISVMSALACGVTFAGGPAAVAIGALAFTASDVSVARDRFVRPGFLNRAWGLPLYYAAQVLLALTPAWITA